MSGINTLLLLVVIVLLLIGGAWWYANYVTNPQPAPQQQGVQVNLGTTGAQQH